MVLDSLRSVVSRRPGWVIGFWVAVTTAVLALAPNLSRISAEGQAKALGQNAESVRAAAIVRQAWPDQYFESLAVAALHRPSGLTAADRTYYREMARVFAAKDRPREILRVLGPDSPAEVVQRLESADGTVLLLAAPLGTSFVAPATHQTVAWLKSRVAASGQTIPEGLELHWTGDAVLGRDYMANVQKSLDRAAVATVILLLSVLLYVYRSLLLSLVPLVTIGVSLAISRGLLAWMTQLGWEISPLVELFMVAILFGTGTDFCLFISWRYGEHFNPANPAGAMRVTLRRATLALLTSAGTVIVGLSLMGATRFKLFSSTGPSVAIGLVISLAATLTLTPALLVLLARLRPQEFRGLIAPSTGFWERLGRKAMARPVLSWVGSLLFMLPLGALSLRSTFVQDLMTELPAETPSARSFRLLATKFEPGSLAPLTVVLESDRDLRDSRGLALIDDVSRLLTRQRRLVEVRSATQPLGNPATLAAARLHSRLSAVDEGFGRMSDGAEALEKGLAAGAAKLRAALWLQENTGLQLALGSRETPETKNAGAKSTKAREVLASGLRQVSTAMLGNFTSETSRAVFRPQPEPTASPAPSEPRPHDTLIAELNKAAGGAGQIARGARLAHGEVSAILGDPYGKEALDHLLITAQTVREHPELRRGFDTYITRDGRQARIDLTQADRVFSAPAMDQVETLRHRLNDCLGDLDAMTVRATVAGPNAESADIRALTRSDQLRSWILVPAGVFLILMIALRDPLACFNLVATMVLTYAFALGATHLVFVMMLGAPGIDWKVPYFLFVLLVAVGVDYNVFLMDRVRQESESLGLRAGIVRAIGRTGGLISSAAAITACSFSSFLFSPLGSLRQLGFALVVGIAVDALLVRPLLVPCGHWLMSRHKARLAPKAIGHHGPVLGTLVYAAD